MQWINPWAVKSFINKGNSQERGSFKAEQLQWCLSMGLEPIIPTHLSGHLSYKDSKKKPLIFFGLHPVLLLTPVKLGGFNPSASEIQLTFKNVTHANVIQTLRSGSFQVVWEIPTHKSQKQCVWIRVGSSFSAEVDHCENSWGIHLNSAQVNFWCLWKPSQKCTDLKIQAGCEESLSPHTGNKNKVCYLKIYFGSLFFFFFKSLIWNLYFQSVQTPGELTAVIWWVPSYFNNNSLKIKIFSFVETQI